MGFKGTAQCVPLSGVYSISVSRFQWKQDISGSTPESVCGLQCLLYYSSTNVSFSIRCFSKKK